MLPVLQQVISLWAFLIAYQQDRVSHNASFTLQIIKSQRNCSNANMISQCPDETYFMLITTSEIENSSLSENSMDSTRRKLVYLLWAVGQQALHVPSVFDRNDMRLY